MKIAIYFQSEDISIYFSNFQTSDNGILRQKKMLLIQLLPILIIEFEWKKKPFRIVWKWFQKIEL